MRGVSRRQLTRVRALHRETQQRQTALWAKRVGLVQMRVIWTTTGSRVITLLLLVSWPLSSLAIALLGAKARVPSIDVQELLTACKVVQSPSARRRVEDCILRLQEKASKNANLRQRIKLGAAYRTIWSTVTASTLPGQVLRQAPNKILGGDSWQIISKDGRRAENIVYWKTIGDFSLRMAGLADLKPLPPASNGYELIIKGLEFRWGAKGYLPEVYPPPPSTRAQTPAGSARLFYLDDGKELDNGRGTLDILYFDGQLRISRDSVAANTYVHLLEPLGNSPFFAQQYPDLV